MGLRARITNESSWSCRPLICTFFPSAFSIMNSQTSELAWAESWSLSGVFVDVQPRLRTAQDAGHCSLSTGRAQVVAWRSRATRVERTMPHRHTADEYCAGA